jgi:drug/metabolite transporter (DMT)-like permease
MTPVALALLTASAFVHAAWNWLGKRGTPSAAFYLAACAAGCLFLSPVLIANARALPALLSAAWPLLAVSGLSQAVYYAALARAYRTGDLSTAYPTVRAATVLLVLAASFVLGRGRQLGPLAIAGIVVVAAGILALPRARFRGFRARELLAPTTLFALAAAVGSMGYSLSDDQALRLLRPLLAPWSTDVETALLWNLLECAATCAWLAAGLAAARLLRRGRPAEPRSAGARPAAAILTGLGITLAYGLVLVAMGFARNVSYVVAFRQLSVPIGVAFGVIGLREPFPAPKAAGVAAILAGLVLVALG